MEMKKRFFLEFAAFIFLCFINLQLHAHNPAGLAAVYDYARYFLIVIYISSAIVSIIFSVFLHKKANRFRFYDPVLFILGAFLSAYFITIISSGFIFGMTQNGSVSDEHVPIILGACTSLGSFLGGFIVYSILKKINRKKEG